ncbi:multicopper oxidase family protein [Flindersiella endophytica]
MRSDDISTVLSGLGALLWLVAGFLAGRLATAGPERGRRRRARLLLVLLVPAAVPVAVKLTNIGLRLLDGWWFAADGLIVVAPLLAGPLTAVAVHVLPRLWRLARVSGDDTRLDPVAVAEIQLVPFAILLAAYVGHIAQPASPYVGDVVASWLVLVLTGAALWYRQCHRQRTLGTRRSLLRRVWHAAAPVLTALVLLASAFAYLRSGSFPPEQASAAGHHTTDSGGGPVASDAHPTNIATLTGPSGPPDRSFTLVAARRQVRLSGGEVVDGMAFNGRVPGPELRVRRGELVNVRLVNKLPAAGVTIHWHGLDVPNAEDGVAGVTQNAVPPGRSHVYRFRADQVGTFWYHTHQEPFRSLRAGLFGALVVLPATGELPDAQADFTVLANTWAAPGGPRPAFGTSEGLRRRVVRPGTRVRLRLVNTDSHPTDEAQRRAFALSGTSFKVVAIDGTDLNRPTPLRDVRLRVPAGGRYDLSFVMPRSPVRLTDLTNPAGGEVFVPDAAGATNAAAIPRPALDAPAFDPLDYGTDRPTPFDENSVYDRSFEQVVDDGLGFANGRLDFVATINGERFPDVPTMVVSEGDLVKVTVVNLSHNEHPFHLHGHHVLVLSVNGRRSTGSPWWTDTFGVGRGEVVEVAFRAGNPGVWMDHCHNLEHAANGMALHLTYDNVRSPYLVGRRSGNIPE